MHKKYRQKNTNICLYSFRWQVRFVQRVSEMYENQLQIASQIIIKREGKYLISNLPNLEKNISLRIKLQVCCSLNKLHWRTAHKLVARDIFLSVSNNNKMQSSPVQVVVAALIKTMHVQKTGMCRVCFTHRFTRLPSRANRSNWPLANTKVVTYF